MSVNIGNDGGQYYVKLSNGKEEAKIPCKNKEEADKVAEEAKTLEAQAGGKAQGTDAPKDAAPAPATEQTAGQDSQVTTPTAATNPIQTSAFNGPAPDGSAIAQATLGDNQGKKLQAFA